MSILTYYHKCPLGILEIKVDEVYLYSIKYSQKKEIYSQQKKNKNVLKVIRQLEEYFGGSRKIFNLPFLLIGSSFEKKVYQNLIKIPYGEKKTYKEIAENCESPKAFRAVGNACRKNKLLFIIPCHRIIGANEKLIGFSAGGIQNQQWLLSLEKIKKVKLYESDK